MSRFLLLPCNNTLSHLAKCLAVRDRLQARGHEAFIAVSEARRGFLERLGLDHAFVLPDLQEADQGSSPTFSWFRPQRVEACVRAETQLMRRLRPDRVLGIFRFTAPLSARLAGVPCDSLICGSMTPACTDVLGFDIGEAGREEQACALKNLRAVCAHRMRPALDEFGLDPVEDIWELMLGDRTFLWDFPAFQPLPATAGCVHVGPVRWSGWPHEPADLAALDKLHGPLACVSFGTGHVSSAVLQHVVDVLLNLGYSVAVGLGGQHAATSLTAIPGRLALFEFLPEYSALSMARLIVCHGGQGTVFEAMRQRIPVFVLPLQPEQAQNGLCLERLGCGRRLQRSSVFNGRVSGDHAAFLARSVAAISEDMRILLDDGQTSTRLAAAAKELSRYHGAEALAAHLSAA
jgi:UDP:flavonoid glycosyltransferase YjiC (YdhE family)